MSEEGWFYVTKLRTWMFDNVYLDPIAKAEPSNEHPGLISFRMDWLDLLAGQGALKSLLQHHT